MQETRLQAWTGEGQIRLSQDDGPSATEFLGDDDDFDDDVRGVELEEGRELESITGVREDVVLDEPHGWKDA